MINVMSILQEYEKHLRLLGREKIEAIDEYLRNLEKKKIDKLYSDVIYKKEEYERFEK
ncbi:MAG: hypothetical protein Q4D22_00220 [Candidatus Saccharibacteria bacterium]|nr:hypothetical protein [Candidatus Saccharibacteria bacterium]